MDEHEIKHHLAPAARAENNQYPSRPVLSRPREATTSLLFSLAGGRTQGTLPIHLLPIYTF